MRAAIFAAVSLLLPFWAIPAQALQVGPTPVLSLSLAPPVKEVYENGTTSVSAQFFGIASVTMGSFDRSTYTLSLSGAIQTGWPVSVAPDTLTFTVTGTQAFCCTVVIPEAPGNATTIVTVTGDLRGGGFTVTNTASCRLDVMVIEPDHSTPGQDNAYMGWVANMFSYTMICVPVLVLIIAAVAGAIYYRRKAKRRRATEALNAQPPLR